MGLSRLTLTAETDNFDRKIAALDEVDASLPGDIRKVILDAAARLADEAAVKVQAEPTHGPKHTGLRATIAAGITVRPTSGGAEINTSMPESDEAVIPRGMDDTEGWKHPVFGHRNNWVRQHGAFSWFMDTMASGKDPITDDLHDLLERAADKIAGA